MTQSASKYVYQVADHVFTVIPSARSWDNLAWHYEPFLINTDDASTSILNINIEKGFIDKASIPNLEEIYTEAAKNPGELTMRVYNVGNDYLFELQPAYCSDPCAWARISKDFKRSHITIDEDNKRVHPLQGEGALTSALMLSYLLATTQRDTLMAHAACVTNSDRAFLFIAKSGTGKSTQARQWLEHIPGSQLLNDDHPIVRICGEEVWAFGSPWSGKTHCYKNEKAPIGAIVRIKRDDTNHIDALGPVQAYASLMSSFSGMTWEPALADGKHKSVEALVRNVPCYVLSCLPNKEAAEVCHAAVMK